MWSISGQGIHSGVVHLWVGHDEGIRTWEIHLGEADMVSGQGIRVGVVSILSRNRVGG